MKTYYQPIEYFDDGVNIGWGDVPDGLWDFQAFSSREDCEFWLKEHGYEPGDFNITEYHDDDIEDVVIIDGDGDVVRNTAERIMETMIIQGMSTPKELKKFENKEIEKVILRFETGIYEEDIICYPAYVINEKFEEVKKDIDELRSNK